MTDRIKLIKQYILVTLCCQMEAMRSQSRLNAENAAQVFFALLVLVCVIKVSSLLLVSMLLCQSGVTDVVWIEPCPNRCASSWKPTLASYEVTSRQ